MIGKRLDALTLERFVPPLAADSWRILPWFALATLLLFWIWTPLGWVGVAATVWCATLFREPPRTAPLDAAATIGPLDGVVTEVGSALPPVELGLAGGELRCISIALGPWDSHVLRAPAEGRLVRSSTLYSGSDERVAMRVAGPAGEVGMIVSALGWGRRVRLNVAEGRELKLGDTLGAVLFAGHVEIYLPPGTEPAVVAGQRVVGGETLLAGPAPRATP
jgi:phosphatidylserine decarboxylase